MPRITQLKLADRKATCTAVYLDGEEWALLDSEVVLRNRLCKAQDLSEEIMQALLNEDAFVRARRVAARLLAVRPRSIEELRARLREYRPRPPRKRKACSEDPQTSPGKPESIALPSRFSSETIDSIVDYFTGKGDLDDYQFACRFARHQIGLRTFGKLKVRTALRAYGVEESIIEKALATAMHGREGVEETAIEALIRKKLPRYQKETRPKQRAKMEAALLRAGFEPDIYRPILFRALAQGDDG